MAPNLLPLRSSMTSSYISNSIALRNRIVVSTCGVDTKFKSKTIPCQKAAPCAREVCMASWLRCPNSRAGRENGRPMTSHLWAAWSLSCRTVRPLLTSRKFRVLQAALWIVTKDYPARSICRVVKMDTSLFGTSRLRRQVTEQEKRADRPARFLPNGDRHASPHYGFHSKENTEKRHGRNTSNLTRRGTPDSPNLISILTSPPAAGRWPCVFLFFSLLKDFPLFPVKDTAHSVSTESVHRHIAPCSDEQMK